MEKYKVLCKEANVPEGLINDNFLFTIENADYFFFNRNIGTVGIIEGFVDGSRDGGIDFIYNDDDNMYLLQGKSSESITIEDIKNIFNKMIITIEKINKNNYSDLSDRLVSNYLNAYGSISEQKNIVLVLFTNSMLTDELKRKINELKELSEYDKYTIIVYDKNDIENKKMINNEPDSVDEYRLQLYDTKNLLKYTENGLIVNVSANALKTLFKAKKGKGLFTYNLRDYVKQANVDNGINNTIKNEPQNFWYYNNGITIGCEDFTIDGSMIHLYNFSIINGAQTTTQIGESDIIRDGYDFPIVCKIVKPSISLSKDSDFLMKISEASNSQKPIKPRDLKANFPEQKELQRRAIKNEGKELAIEIKRGVRPSNYNSVEPWQRVKNELIGQLILSCLLQHPGDAKTSSSGIFDNKTTYSMVFRRKQDYNTLFDIVKLDGLFNEFKKEYLSESDDIEKISVVKAGKFTIYSVIFYLIKRFKKLVKNRNDENVFVDNLDGDIFSNELPDDYERTLKNLFKFIIKKLNDVYTVRKNELKLTSHASFFKNDTYYKTYILKEIDDILTDEEDYEKIEKYMKIFNI